MDNIHTPSYSKQSSEDEIDLLELLLVFKRHLRKIIFITAIFALLGVAYSYLATPIYQADAMLQYDKMGQPDFFDQVDRFLPFGGGNTDVDSQLEIIKSRLVLDQTVNDLNLDIKVVASGFLAGLLNRGATFEFEGFALIDEIESPITLTYLGEEEYRVDIGGKTFQGWFNQPLKADALQITVTSIEAKPQTVFLIHRASRYDAINALRSNLSLSETKQGTRIIRLTVKGPDKLKNVAILDHIINTYLEQNEARKREVTANTLEFLETYLPQVKTRLDEHVQELNDFRRKNESVDLTLEAKTALESSLQVEEKLNALTIREVEIRELYTQNHPVYRSLLETREELLKERNQISRKIQGLPDTQQQIIRLTRDVESERTIYEQLMAKQQELNVLASGITADARIIDTPVSKPSPIEPKKKLIVLVFLLLGGMVGCGYVLVREFFNNKIKRIEEVEGLGINVYASIPLSQFGRRKSNTDTSSLLAIDNPADLAVEAIRSLRTSVYFSIINQKNNLVMVTSATPNVGKTFITANLATVFAGADKRVLLIDGDLRKGRLHKMFSILNPRMTEKKGLADYLVNADEGEAPIYKTEVDNLMLMPRGSAVVQSSELLMGEAFKELLKKVQDEYDIVLIDTPPLLAITDAAIIGKYVGTTLLAAYYHLSTVKELQLTLNRLAQNQVDVSGLVLNGVDEKSEDYYYVYEYE